MAEFRNKIADEIHQHQIIDAETHQRISSFEEAEKFSLHWELRFLLTLGITAVTSGLGILIYNNINSLGHVILLIAIALTTIACYFYAFKKTVPFSKSKTGSTDTFHDYAVLSGAALFLIFEGYMQYKFNLFGEHYEWPTGFAVLFLFYVSYRFDHQGTLSMGITTLAAWFGVVVTPKELLRVNDFSSTRIIETSFVLGIILLIAYFCTKRFEIKTHFAVMYYCYAFILLFIAGISALFSFDIKVIWMLIGTAIAVLSFIVMRNEQSVFLLVTNAIYFYILVTYCFFSLLDLIGGTELYFTFGILYFIPSCMALVLFVRNHRKFFYK